MTTIYRLIILSVAVLIIISPTVAEAQDANPQDDYNACIFHGGDPASCARLTGFSPIDNGNGSQTSSSSKNSVSCSVQGTTWLSGIVKDGLLMPCACIDSDSKTDCGLNEAMQTIINITQLIVAVTGSLALLMFGYGGLTFILASGNQERLQQAKQILLTAATGIIIILGAWLIVNFTILALTGGTVGSTAQIFGRPFSQTP